MLLAYGTLHWGEINSWADFVAGWGAYQRAALEVSAFVDFCGAFLPGDGSKIMQFFSECCVHHDITNHSGVILAGNNIKTFFDLSCRLCVPMYVHLRLDKFDVPDKELQLPDHVRCSVNISDLPNEWKKSYILMFSNSSQVIVIRKN